MKPRADNSKRFPVRNVAGNRQCRECGKERQPGVTWLSWCGEECVEAYKVRAWPAHAAKAAMKRDQGVCAQCGVDTQKLKQWLHSLPNALAPVTMHSPRVILTFGGVVVHDGPSDIVKNFALYGREDRYTRANHNGRQLGRHRARAYVLLGRLWGVRLSSSSHLFEIDHIVAVAEGGGGCGLDNLRTLCRRCHRVESAALNNRLRKRPSKGVGRGF